MNNYEWLLQMSGEERQAWFDAPHADCGQVDGNHSKVDSDDSNVTQKEPVSLRDCFGILSDAPKCFEMLRNEQDSREKLEADVLKYYTHTTSTLMWPDDANIKTKWVSVSMDTVLEWFDRAADIREREFVQQYCAECETAENAALKDDIATLREELAKLQAENDTLLAAHADDVERLDSMGEGELIRKLDNLAHDLAESERLREEMREELSIAYDHAHDLLARRDRGLA